eukprot:6189780-Pleurochrysis_carterae.AAC.1
MAQPHQWTAAAAVLHLHSAQPVAGALSRAHVLAQQAVPAAPSGAAASQKPQQLLGQRHLRHGQSRVLGALHGPDHPVHHPAHPLLAHGGAARAW